jgi:hypothetical protein
VAKRVVATTSRRGDLERSTHWLGLVAGDAVIVNTDKERRHDYVFVAYVLNHATSDAWVEVRGGRKGEAKDRSFPPETIYPGTARSGSRVRGLPLIAAPQLPWSS